MVKSKKIRVFIDATPLVNEFRHRGVGKMAYSAIKTLVNNKDIHWILGSTGEKHTLFSNLNLDEDSEIDFVSFGKKRHLLQEFFGNIYFQLFMRNKIQITSPDIYVTFQLNRTFPSDLYSIVYIPDIIPKKLDFYSSKNKLVNYLKKKNYIWLLERAKKAKKIMTISNFSKTDLVSEGFDESKIKVSYLALTQEIIDNISKMNESQKIESETRRIMNMYNLKGQYILYIGGLEKNKNVSTLISAFAEITKYYPDVDLVIGGGEFKLGWDHKPKPQNERAEYILNLVYELKLQHKVRFTGFIEEFHLPYVLKSSEVFIHLSEYEGFGLAVLEPQILGIPVIAANASSYPEVLGSSAILVDQHDPKEITQKVRDLFAQKSSDSVEYKNLIEKGIENTKRFSWANFSSDLLAEIKKSAVSIPVQTKGIDLEKKIRINETKKIDEVILKKAVILISYFFPFIGGAEKVALEYAKILVNEGYQVSVITSKRKSDKVVAKSNETHEGINIVRLNRTGDNYYIFNLWKLLRTLISIKPDLVHVHGFGFLLFDFKLLIFKFIQKLNKKNTLFINTPHGPFMSKSEKGFRRIFKKISDTIQSIYLNKLYNFIFEVNTFQSDWIVRDYKIDQNKIRFFPPIVDLNKDSTTNSYKETKSNNKKSQQKKLKILSIGRIQKYKGFDTIINSLSKLPKDFELIIAGSDADYTETLKDKISNSKNSAISLEIDITEERKIELYKDADIFVLASEWEAFGIVLIEAMSMGCIVISTKTEGGEFIINTSKVGKLFDYKDDDKLAEILEYYNINRLQLKKESSIGVEYSKEYNASIISSKYIKLINEYYDLAKT